MATSSGILQSYLIEALSANNEFDHLELLKRNKAAKGAGFLTPLTFYLKRLADTDPVLVSYMFPKVDTPKTKERRDELQLNLEVTYLLLKAQKKYESDHQKLENTSSYDASIQKCEGLLQVLDPKYRKLIQQSPATAYISDGQPVKYCGIALAQEFKQQINDMMERKSKTLKEALGALNEKRLYWIWGSVFLKTVLSMIPEDFQNSKQALGTISSPDPYTGCLSWALYYFRFSLNLFLLLKHTIKGPWMSKEESENTTTFERFQTQWAQRKFTLLNDSIWGTANLLCFFWLNGKGVLGAWGDLITIGLLVFDITISLWDFAEQQTQYNAQMLQFDQEIEDLKAAKLKALHALDQDEEERKLNAYRIQLQINTLERAQKTCKKEWELQKLSLYNNIAYAVGLMLAFVILTTPFMPIPAATAVALGMAGAVLCFAFTVISSAVRGYIEIHKSRDALKDARNEFEEHIDLLKGMLRKNPLLNDNEKKFLFLEIKKFQAKSEYQRQMVVYQTVSLVRSIILETLIPAIIFSSLVFLPLGIGLGALAGALGLAIASHYLINGLLKPDEKMKELPAFDSKEYRSFCDLVENDDSTYMEHYTFFKKHKSDPERLLENTDDVESDFSVDGDSPPVTP